MDATFTWRDDDSDGEKEKENALMLPQDSSSSSSSAICGSMILAFIIAMLEIVRDTVAVAVASSRVDDSRRYFFFLVSDLWFMFII